jgi:hypothetical protein
LGTISSGLYRCLCPSTAYFCRRASIETLPNHRHAAVVAKSRKPKLNLKRRWLTCDP